MRSIELDRLVPVTISPLTQSVEASYLASSLPDGSKLRPILVALFISSIPFLFNYILLSLLYAIENWLARPSQIPPTYPYVIPFLGSTIPFLWDSINFIRSATSYAGKQTPVSVSLLTSKVYIFQGAQNIASLWKKNSLSSPIFVYTVGLKHFFGMRQRSIDVYTADDSGPYRQPNPASNVKPHNRIDFLTHDGLIKGLSGPGLDPAFKRFAHKLTKNLYALNVCEEWTQMPDLLEFFQDHVSIAMIESLYGTTLTSQHPNFIRDLWAFDKVIPKLAKRLPKLIIPQAHKLQKKLLRDIKSWQAVARERFDDSKIYEDGDGDPFWGSELMRSRQKLLLRVDNQDYDSMASTDLGLIWTSVTNVVPSAMMATLQIFMDHSLLSRVRSAVKDAANPTPELSFNIKVLEKQPLMLSVYAETLRLFVQVFVTRCSPHTAVHINNWLLPRNKISMVSSHPAHMDAEVWNTKGGAHPLDKFWAERFLIDPNDPGSGPTRMNVTGHGSTDNKKLIYTVDEVRFSLEGLEGSWIPYGDESSSCSLHVHTADGSAGGHSICPGKHFAKRKILLTCAMMALMFDIEILADNKALELDPSTYGLGVQKPKGKVAFRIRKRELGFNARGSD